MLAVKGKGGRILATLDLIDLYKSGNSYQSSVTKNEKTSKKEKEAIARIDWDTDVTIVKRERAQAIDDSKIYMCLNGMMNVMERVRTMMANIDETGNLDGVYMELCSVENKCLDAKRAIADLMVSREEGE